MSYPVCLVLSLEQLSEGRIRDTRDITRVILEAGATSSSFTLASSSSRDDKATSSAKCNGEGSSRSIRTLMTSATLILVGVTIGNLLQRPSS